MGVVYKLREEVVHFIISQRQSNPFASCRQLAESTSEKFGLNLSKSSVHDVLKESGIVTPRGRKPKNKFEIPQEKKKQIQASLSQVKLISPPVEPEQVQEIKEVSAPPAEHRPILMPGPAAIPEKQSMQISTEYQEAGKIFLKAALWDLGIFSEESIKEIDRGYYLTYSKGINVLLENGRSFFIDMVLPIERCIREAADGLVNNTKPFIVHKVSDEDLFKASMNAQAGLKINKISIVEHKDHILVEINDIVELNRNFILKRRIFVESNEITAIERSKSLFFTETIDNNMFIENILNLKGFDSTNKENNAVTLLVENGYENKTMLQEAAEKVNDMYIYDDQDRLVQIKIEEIV